MNLVGLLFTCLLISFCIECLGIFFGWWTELGSYHSQAVAARYLNMVAGDANSSNFLLNPSAVIQWFSDAIYHWTDFNIYKFITDTHGYVENNTSGELFKQFLFASGFVFTTFLIKVGYLISSLPVLFLIILPCVGDGYAVRMKRTFEGGLDSDFKVKVARMFMGGGFMFVSLLFFSLPIYVEPLFVVLPLFLLTAFGIRMFVITFAKNF
nr:DUF4400 domain-containing protein [Vibrio sp. S11_S32]